MFHVIDELTFNPYSNSLKYIHTLTISFVLTCGGEIQTKDIHMFYHAFIKMKKNIDYATEYFLWKEHSILILMKMLIGTRCTNPNVIINIFIDILVQAELNSYLKKVYSNLRLWFGVIIVNRPCQP